MVKQKKKKKKKKRDGKEKKSIGNTMSSVTEVLDLQK